MMSQARATGADEIPCLCQPPLSFALFESQMILRDQGATGALGVHPNLVGALRSILRSDGDRCPIAHSFSEESRLVCSNPQLKGKNVAIMGLRSAVLSPRSVTPQITLKRFKHFPPGAQVHHRGFRSSRKTAAIRYHEVLLAAASRILPIAKNRRFSDLSQDRTCGEASRRF